MRRLLATAAIVAALCAAVLPTPQVSAAQRPRQVVVVLAPYLTWEDVTATSTPTMWRIARDGAVGDINARSRTRQAGEPASPLEGALTISAGSWAVRSIGAAAAFLYSERYEVDTAADAFRRTTGEQVGENRIVFLGMPATQRENDKRATEVVLGTLGSAVREHGGTTIAIGNSDVGYVTGEQQKVRPAALAAMDSAGLVMLGDVSPHLLKEDPDAPFGIETDLVKFEAALSTAANKADAAGGPQLVVLDAGDAYRATKFESQVTDEIARTRRAAAMAKLDAVVRLAVKRYPDAVVMIASQASGNNLEEIPEGLGPIIIGGDGFHGYLTSNSTQRTGVVTNLDVTATILDILGIKRPVQVLGSAMRSESAPEGLLPRIDHLKRMSHTATAIDAAKPGVVNTFVIVTVIALLCGAFVLVRWRHWTQRTIRWWLFGLRVVLLAVMSIPVASILMVTWSRWPAGTLSVVSALLVTAVVVFAGALALLRYAPWRVPVAVLSLATAFALLIDQWLGAPASFSNFFSYSPLLAARFYGMGNEAAAILVGSSLVGMALLFDQWPGSRWVTWGKRVGIPVLGVLVVVTSAAPFWGANVGVAIWGVVAFGLAYVLMNGHHLSLKIVLLMGVAVVVVIGVFAGIDLYGGGSQTHLGRALTSAEQGGLVELWNIVVRKAETNMRVLTHTNWAYILIATLAFLGFMRWRPQGDFADTLRDNPDFADAITVSLAAGLVAYFTEDSGIVIPALEVFYVGVGIVWLMLARVGRVATDVEVSGQ